MSAVARRPLLSWRGGDDRGAAAIEFALVFPLFVMLTFGMISAGFAFFYDIQLTQAARDAARFGSTYPMESLPSECGAANCVDAGLQQVAEIAARQTGWASADPADITDNGYICVAYFGGGSGTDQSFEHRPSGITPSSSPCVDVGQEGPQVQVVIKRDSELNAVLFSWDVTLGTESIIPWERRQTGPP